MKAYDYLIVGGGIAGTTAAETLRERGGRHISIAILEEEPYPLYSKVLIPDYLKNKVPREKLFLRGISDYEKNNIDFFSSTGAKKLNIDRKEVFTEDGRAFPYKKLLIASGGRPKALPDLLASAADNALPPEMEETPEILRMQSLDDADKIKNALKKPGTALVVGEGFIALEFLSVFAKNNFETHAAARGNFFMEKKFGEEGAEMLENYLLKNRIQTHKRTDLYFIKGKNIILTNNDKIAADAIAVGIGLDRNLEAFEDLKKNRGIVTNEFFETSEKDIYAAGDAAEFYDSIAERNRVAGNWTNSFLQGRAAALNMLGGQNPYQFVTAYNIVCFGLNMTFLGDMENGEEYVEKMYLDENAFARVVLRGGKIRGAALINKFGNLSKLLRLIQEGGGKNELKAVF